MQLQLNLRARLHEPSVIVSHRVHAPQTAADLLINELGLTRAFARTTRELQAARRARSRPRYLFWAKVRETLSELLARPI